MDELAVGLEVGVIGEVLRGSAKGSIPFGDALCILSSGN